MSLSPDHKTDLEKSGINLEMRPEGDSVELDAIPAKRLREIAELCITQHIDREILESTRVIEQAEKDTLENVLETYSEMGFIN